jgi:hypothetical protein
MVHLHQAIMEIMKENKDFVEAFLNPPLPYLSDYEKSGHMNQCASLPSIGG